MPKERILITVKTYPTLSRKYGETVCTAGVRENGSWVRIYPVPFRRLEEAEQYRKYDWIEADFRKSASDPRPETCHPVDIHKLVPVGHMERHDDWRERRQLLINSGKVFSQLQPLISDAKANKRSLAIFKPTVVKEFVVEAEEEREWSIKKMEEMRSLSQQGSFFEEEWRETFKVIPKLPYKFSYRFEDADGRAAQLRILDWEIGALFWNCLRRDQDEQTALEKVRLKYFDQFLKTDLHFFLGTTQQYHQVAPNPWVVIGAFPVPHRNQLDLL